MRKKQASFIEQSALDSYQRGILAKAPESVGDSIAKGCIVADALRTALTANAEMTMPDGSVKSLPAINAIAVAVVADMIAHPSTQKLKDAAAIMGELKSEAPEVSISIVDQGLREAALADGER